MGLNRGIERSTARVVLVLAVTLGALSLPARVAMAVDAPVITAPADGSVVCESGTTSADVTVSGTATAAEDSTVRLYEDGVETALATGIAITGEGTWTTSVTLADGEHGLIATVHDAGSDTESDPSALVAITVDAADRLGAVAATPAVISPKRRDGVKDLTTVSAGVSAPGRVTFAIVRDATVVKHGPTKDLDAPGDATWRWGGKGDDGSFVASRSYTARVTWAREGCPSQVATDAVRVDNVAPNASVKASRTRFFPKENDDLIEYKDTTTLVYSGLSEPAQVKVRVYRAGRSKVIRTINGGFDGNAGGGSIAWNGRTAGGRLLGEGEYDLRLWMRDGAGNVRLSPRVTVRISHKRVDARSVTLSKHADQLFGWDTNSECGDAWESNRYARGVLLDLWDCHWDTEVLLGVWRFTAPAAVVYDRVTPAAYGRSTESNHLFGSVRDYPGKDLISVGYVGSREGLHWFKGADGDRAVNARRRIEVSLFIGDEWSINDYDIRDVRVRVRYGVLVD